MLEVNSEVGRLRRVLLHEPGPEVDIMVPQMMEDLLFDDILFGERVREEHRRFKRLLQLLGIEVVEARKLLVEALEEPEARAWIWEVLRPHLPINLYRSAVELDAVEAAQTLVGGVRCSEDREGVEMEDLFEMPPIPNWCFQRDPQVVVGGGVILSAMATPARWREGLLTRTIFRFHRDYSKTTVLADPLRPICDNTHLLGLHRPRLEGGDLLVLSGDLLCIGLSERTNIQAIEVLIRSLCAQSEGPRWLEIVKLPARRAYMHLDTVFTPADHDAALVYAPVITGTGSEGARTFEVDLHAKNPEPVERGLLLPALKARGIDLKAIPCGGDDPVKAQREQWTDGANTLALAPGIITLYDRNVATAARLDEEGFDVLSAEDVLLGRREISLNRDYRTCILLESNEISRARGGPHCLSHPLRRDE